MNSKSNDIPEQGGPSCTPAESLSVAGVATLAQAAGLTLGPGREALLLPILRLWLADSVALNSVMQSEAYRAVLPVTLFKHERDAAGQSQ